MWDTIRSKKKSVSETREDTCENNQAITKGNAVFYAYNALKSTLATRIAVVFDTYIHIRA